MTTVHNSSKLVQLRAILITFSSLCLTVVGVSMLFIHAECSVLHVFNLKTGGFFFNFFCPVLCALKILSKLNMAQKHVYT